MHNSIRSFLATLPPHAARLSCLVVIATLVTGCPSPNMYTTARTLPRGKMAHMVSVETLGAAVDNSQTDVEGSVALPSMPSYELRYGASDNFELDARVTLGLTLGLRGKYNFLRQRTVDLAVAPGVQYFGISSNESALRVFHGSLPLLVDSIRSRLALAVTPSLLQGSCHSLESVSTCGLER